MEPPTTPACDPGKLRLFEDAEDWQPRTGTSQSRSFRKLARLTGTDGRKSLLLPAAVGCCGSRWHRAVAVVAPCYPGVWCRPCGAVGALSVLWAVCGHTVVPGVLVWGKQGGVPGPRPFVLCGAVLPPTDSVSSFLPAALS